MSGLVEALRAYRDGTLSRESLLGEVARQLAEQEIDAISLLRLLNDEHARARLPDNLHGTIAARILQWRESAPRRESAGPAVTNLGSGVDGLHAEADVRRASPLMPGSVLQGRYKLIETLAQGGQGAVYKAIDLQAQPRDVVVRLLTPSHTSAWTQSDAERLQNLCHPNIAKLIDCGHEGRAVFLVTEYLSGGPLKRKLHSPGFRGMPRAAAEEIIDGIAAALEFAHAQHVVHGELDPANVFITDQREVKVINFGVPRPGPAPDPRDDVYGLACIVYELLTGTHPYEERSALEACELGLRPARPDTLSQSEFKAIAHGLDLDPQQRPASVAQFLTALRARRAYRDLPLLSGSAIALMVVVSLYFSLRGRIQTASDTAPRSRAVFRDCPTCPLMKVLPPGRFNQGAPDDDPDAQAIERPQHTVVIAYPLSMGAYEVTLGEFKEFVDATSRTSSGCTVYDGGWTLRTDANWSDVGYPQTSVHPVACVSWQDALDYTLWLSHKTGQHYRLPSASEWEYAARAGAAASRPWRGNTQLACSSANVADQSAAQRYSGWRVHACKDGYVYSAPVGSFAPNAFGLYDMLGNVSEWVQDCWHADYRGAPHDGSAWMTGDCVEHDLRGGSWFTSPPNVSVTARSHFESGYRSNSIGFRIVREIE